MTVKKQELEDLQLYIQKQLNRMNSSESVDNAAVFDLQTIDSNISFIISSADIQGEELIELGTKDKNVKDLLTEYRHNIFTENKSEQFITDIGFCAEQSIYHINDALAKAQSIDNPVLIKNLENAFNIAVESLEQIVSLSENTRKYNKWKTDNIELEDIVKSLKKNVKAEPDKQDKSPVKSTRTSSKTSLRTTVKKTLIKK